MGNSMCKTVCWIVAALIAVIAAFAIDDMIDPSTIVLIIIALIIFAILAYAFPRMFCSASDNVSAVAPPATAPSSVASAPSAPATAPVAAPSPAPKAAPEPAATPAPAASGGHWTDSVGASGKAGASRGQTGLKPSVELSDEATVRDNVGSWRYESGASAYRAAPQAAAPAAEGDYDGDGIVEGVNEGTKPATLDAARGGAPDDLKQIKGVGPKMEGLLHSLGFFHFDQVASWSDQEVAWVDANLQGFKGRVSRDNWVAQAKILAEGGETEFSKRVGDGGVY